MTPNEYAEDTELHVVGHRTLERFASNEGSDTGPHPVGIRFTSRIRDAPSKATLRTFQTIDSWTRPNTGVTADNSVTALPGADDHHETIPLGGVPGVNDDNGEYLKGWQMTCLIIGLMMASFLLMIDSTVLVTAIPSITSAFQSTEDIGWYGSSYLLATCALQLLFGKIYQYYNSKVVFISAFVVFEIGSLLCGAAQSSIMFIMGRVVSGLGGAGILNGAFVIVAAAAPVASRPKLIGLILGVASTGVALGPLLGGALTEHASWRWCFYLNLPVGAITVITLSIIRLPNAKIKMAEIRVTAMEQVARLDLLGCALFSGTVVMVLLALDWGGTTYRWDSPTIINLFWGSGFAFNLFLFWEYSMGDAAMLPLKMCSNPIIACSALTGIMSYGGLYVIIVYLPLWFQAVKGASPLMSGVYYLPSVVTTTTGTIVTGIIVTKVGYYAPFMVAGGALAAIAAGLMTMFTPHASTASWVCYQLLNGVARGMMAQIPVTAVQSNLPKELISIGTALVVFSQNFGASLFISLGQTAFENSLIPALHKHAPEVNAELVASIGATAFKSVVAPESVPHVLAAFNQALTTTFFLSVGASVAVFALSWGLGWKNLKNVPE